MKHLTLYISIVMLAMSSFVMAQEDDMYFNPKKDKQEKKSKAEKKTYQIEVIYEDDETVSAQDQSARITATAPTSSLRDVDEYNRRGRSSSVSSTDTLKITATTDTHDGQTYQLSAQSLYDLGYSEGYEEGFSDGNDIDFYYGLRLARFHGCHFYDPWYWSRVSYVYDPWHWDPWYWDPWYRPYYYGGWYSVGWGIGYMGTYWNPYWPGYYPYYPHSPHYGHHPHHPHHGPGHGPNFSTSRNRDYGSARVVDRRSRPGDSRTPSHEATRRSSQRSSDLSSRYNERRDSRSSRVTDRSNTQTRERSNTQTRERSNTQTRERSINRSTNRSTSTSRVGSGSSSSRNGGTAPSRSHTGGGRSGGGRSGGGFRGR